MRPVITIARMLLGAAPWSMARGVALSIAVLVMGAALLGLSGWFITATGLAGLAGLGITFDVFRPSAGVRFLALGRTAARYGERVLSHDATLRALAALRTMLLRQHARLGVRSLARLRGEGVLTRIVSDVDALDGLALRVLLPVFAGVVTHACVFVVLAWLAGWPVAATVLVGYLPASIAVLWFLARRTLAPSDASERAGQQLRRGAIDMIRDRESLIVSGQLPQRELALLEIDRDAREAAARLDLEERNAGLALSLVVSLVTAAALVAGGWMLAEERVGPAVAAIALFVALALAETVLPLRRGFAEIGRMAGAARRVALENGEQRPDDRPDLRGGTVLDVSLTETAFRVEPGMAVALTGPSGSGKTSLLNRIAGLGEGAGEGVTVDGRRPTDWSEASLRAQMAFLPQRSALIAGTVRDNLTLAGPTDDATLWAALDAVTLGDVIRARGGLDTRLGEGGRGLSGGQARRLALARIVLKEPSIVLLDEPTEGLDAVTADAVLTGVRTALPNAAIVAALHRGADHPVFDEVREIAG